MTTITIPASPLFGNKYADLRSELRAAGARPKMNTETSNLQWHLPDAVYKRFMSRLPEGCVAGLTQPVSSMVAPAAAAAPATPPPALIVPVGAMASLPAPREPQLVAPQPVAVPKPASPQPPPQKIPDGPASPASSAEPAKQLPLSKELILVTQEVSNPGDVTYRSLGHEQTDLEGSEVRTVQTVKTSQKIVKNPEEQDKARKLAGTIRGSLRGLGRVLLSGVVLVPKEDEEELDKMLADARKEASDFNSAARHHFVRVSTLKIPLLSQDADVAKELTFTIQQSLGELRDALDKCDVKRIRNVAAQMKSLSRVLPDAEGSAVNRAVVNARSLATWANEELTKKKRSIEEVRRDLDLSPVDEIRMQFLEYDVADDAGAMKTSVDSARFEELEMDEEPTAEEQAAAASLSAELNPGGAGVDAGRFSDLDQ